MQVLPGNQHCIIALRAECIRLPVRALTEVSISERRERVAKGLGVYNRDFRVCLLVA